MVVEVDSSPAQPAAFANAPRAIEPPGSPGLSLDVDAGILPSHLKEGPGELTAADTEFIAPPPLAGTDGLLLDLPPEVRPSDSEDVLIEPGDMPSFVREADRAARWRRPGVRAALAVACVAACLALVGQWVIAQRDVVAARSTTLKPMLEAACAALGCEVLPPRALEALRVESSGLVRVDKSDLYRLTVALRNLRSHEVALPAIELALTDTQGQLIARRVLRAREVGARVDALATGAELTLQGTLQVSSGMVAGYTIELFYP